MVSSVPPWNAGSEIESPTKAAKRLGLGGDHGDDLSLRDLAKLRQWKAQDTMEQVVAQPTQHALADHTAIDVQEVLEPAVDEHQRQKDCAQREQVFQLFQLKPKSSREPVPPPMAC